MVTIKSRVNDAWNSINVFTLRMVIALLEILSIFNHKSLTQIANRHVKENFNNHFTQCKVPYCQTASERNCLHELI